MKTFHNIRPKFTGIKVGNIGDDDYIPAIYGRINEEIWFDKSNVNLATLGRISLLVEAAYDLGITHTFEVINDQKIK